MNKHNFKGKQFGKFGKFARQTLGKLQEEDLQIQEESAYSVRETNPRGEMVHLKGKLVIERNPGKRSRKKAKFLSTKLKVRE